MHPSVTYWIVLWQFSITFKWHSFKILKPFGIKPHQLRISFTTYPPHSSLTRKHLLTSDTIPKDEFLAPHHVPVFNVTIPRVTKAVNQSVLSDACPRVSRAEKKTIVTLHWDVVGRCARLWAFVFLQIKIGRYGKVALSHPHSEHKIPLKNIYI